MLSIAIKVFFLFTEHIFFSNYIDACPPTCLCKEQSGFYYYFANRTSLSFQETISFIHYRVVRLILYMAEMKYLQQTDLGHLRYLTKLEITAPKLEAIEDNAFLNSFALASLKIRNTKIKTITSNAFNGLGNLLNLAIVQNQQLRSIQSYAFISLYFLDMLDLSRNKLSVIGEHTLAGLTRMRRLALNNNCLKSIHMMTLRNKTGLKTLILGKNLLTEIPKTFIYLLNLEELNIKQNRIVRVENSTFKNIRNLAYISLDNNKIETIGNDVFSTLPSLKRLSMKGNSIRTFGDSSAWGLDEIRTKFEAYLDISYNKFLCTCFRILESLVRTLRIKADCLLGNDRVSIEPTTKNLCSVFFKDWQSQNVLGKHDEASTLNTFGKQFMLAFNIRVNHSNHVLLILGGKDGKMQDQQLLLVEKSSTNLVIQFETDSCESYLRYIHPIRFEEWYSIELRRTFKQSRFELLLVINGEIKHNSTNSSAAIYHLVSVQRSNFSSTIRNIQYYTKDCSVANGNCQHICFYNTTLEAKECKCIFGK